MDRHDTMTHLFGARRALIGMIHVGALPGTPAAGATLERVIETAVAEARAYRDSGYTALMIENMHDRPYLKGAVGPEGVAAMTAGGQRAFGPGLQGVEGALETESLDGHVMGERGLHQQRGLEPPAVVGRDRPPPPSSPAVGHRPGQAPPVRQRGRAGPADPCPLVVAQRAERRRERSVVCP